MRYKFLKDREADNIQPVEMSSDGRLITYRNNYYYTKDENNNLKIIVNRCSILMPYNLAYLLQNSTESGLSVCCEDKTFITYNYDAEEYETYEPEHIYIIKQRMKRKDKIVEVDSIGYTVIGLIADYFRGSATIPYENKRNLTENRYYSIHSMRFALKLRTVIKNGFIDEGFWWDTKRTQYEDFKFDNIKISELSDEQFASTFGITRDEIKNYEGDYFEIFRINNNGTTKYMTLTKDNRVEKFNEMLLNKFGTGSRGQNLEIVDIKEEIYKWLR